MFHQQSLCEPQNCEDSGGCRSIARRLESVVSARVIAMALAIERLDLVARSEAVGPFISKSRIFLLLLALFGIFLAVNSTAPFRETVLVAILGASSLITAVVLWLNWRYKVFVLALFWLLLAILEVLSHDKPSSHTVLGWVFAHALAPALAYYGFGVWMMAKSYSLANSNGFRDEKNQFEKWKRLLNAHDEPNVAEFTTGDFSTGYWTYRILNTGVCWVVAQFKRGSNKLKSCHVYDLSCVTFTRLSSGKWQITITPKSGGTKSFVEVEMPLSFPIPNQLM